MKNSVAKMFENRAELDDIEGRSYTLKNTADKFRMTSQRLERMTKWRNLRMKALVAFMMFMLFIVIYYFIL